MTTRMNLTGRIRGKVIVAPENQRFYVLKWRIRNWLKQRWRELPLEAWLLILRIAKRVVPGLNMPMHGRLRGRIITKNGLIIDLGHIGVHLITTVGKDFLAGAWYGSNTLANLKYHAFGTSSTAATVGDTALGTELTTEYATANTRPTGTLVQGASANILESVGTITASAAAAITEWGLMDQAATGAGTLFDHQVFAVVNLSAGNSYQITYDLTMG